VDIRADQLRFTRDEMTAFLNDTMGLTLSADDLSAMEIRTEGWIAGLQQPPPQLLIEPLTTREIEVMKLIESGCSNQEIAEKLVIYFTTVKRHISNIYTKLDAKNRTQAIAIGKELKLFE
jgi:ATP/maltotriose-dependent transcriptional regulator MalT